jgi:hypothetical protein
MHTNIPKSILLSVALLVVAHAVGFWEMVLLSRTLGVPLWMPYSTLTFAYLLLAVLLTMILLGKPWARITYVVFFVLNLFATLGHLTNLSATGRLMIAIKIAAIVLLYVSSSNSWFKNDSDKSSSLGNST